MHSYEMKRCFLDWKYNKIIRGLTLVRYKWYIILLTKINSIIFAFIVCTMKHNVIGCYFCYCIKSELYFTQLSERQYLVCYWLILGYKLRHCITGNLDLCFERHNGRVQRVIMVASVNILDDALANVLPVSKGLVDKIKSIICINIKNLIRKSF